MNRFHPNDVCFCCGDDNPMSLGLQVEAVAGAVVGRARLDQRHQGRPGVAHGGAIATLMDELLGAVAVDAERDRTAVTATLTIDYRAPLLLPQEVRLRAWCERTSGRKLFLRGAMSADERLVAEAHGIWVLVDDDAPPRGKL